MKEILYIQAGAQANYVGTHFWNTQESYFTYEEDGDPEGSDVAHGISFREGLNLKGESTFCPRLLIFDHKCRLVLLRKILHDLPVAEFGSLSQSNALYGMNENTDAGIPWAGDAIEHKQEVISQSKYQTDMEELDLGTVDVSSAVQLDDVRYWSDFNRPHHIPRTIQKIPDVPEWEDMEGNWAVGHETFTKYDEDTGLMEGPVRLFLEECEAIQGIQLTLDTTKFGSFINSLLTSMRDEGTKMPVLVFPLLSDVLAPFNHLETRRATRKIINDMLVLRGLSELASMGIPAQPPTSWPDDVCSNTYMHASRTHAYHTSAVLSAHIETGTLPLRLNRTTDDIHSFAAQLREGSTLPFSEMRGVFPSAADASDSLSLGLDNRIYNFSSTVTTPGTIHPAHFRRDVTRGFAASAVAYYNEWAHHPRPGSGSLAFITSTHAGAYPIPTSFPAFFRNADELPSDSEFRPGILSRARTTSVFTSLGATRGTPALFGAYSRFLDGGVRRAAASGWAAAVQDIGLEREDVAELAADLWVLHDRASDLDPQAQDGESDADSRGEDEE